MQLENVTAENEEDDDEGGVEEEEQSGDEHGADNVEQDDDDDDNDDDEEQENNEKKEESSKGEDSVSFFILSARLFLSLFSIAYCFYLFVCTGKKGCLIVNLFCKWKKHYFHPLFPLFVPRKEHCFYIVLIPAPCKKRMS